MRKAKTCFGVTLRRVLLMAAVLVSMSPMARAATVIPDENWPDQPFLRTAPEEDARVTLRALLEQAGMQVVIRPEVKEKTIPVFYSDKIRTSLHAAFNQLIDVSGFSYDYDGKTKTVTLSQPTATTSDFVVLKLVTLTAVKSLVNNFHLNVDVIFDDATQTLMLKGDSEQVGKLRQLIDKREDALAAAEKAKADEIGKGSAAAKDQAVASRTQAEAQLLADRADRERRAQAEVDQITVEVIPLHYASVGPVRVQFQGENVTIPGVIDTLNNLLGVTAAKAAAEAVGQDNSGQNKILRLGLESRQPDDRSSQRRHIPGDAVAGRTFDPGAGEQARRLPRYAFRGCADQFRDRARDAHPDRPGQEVDRAARPPDGAG
jgi:type II secretory pathway component GspD/PulD (secretin)